VKILITALLASSTLAFPALAAGSGDLCQRLAQQARHLPASAWSAGVQKALAPSLTIVKEDSPGAPGNKDILAFERSLTQLPWVQDAVSGKYYGSFVSRLPKRDIYMVSSYSGSANCQSTVFVEAREGRKAKKAKSPEIAEDGKGACWTQSGKLGTVYSHAAYIQGGALSDHTFDTTYNIVPWTGKDWAEGCAVTLRFHTSYRLTNRNCADQAVCGAAAEQALAIAEAYNSFRAGRDRGQAGDNTFSFGPTAPQAAREAVAEAANQPLPIGRTPEFPTFGGSQTSNFAATGLSFFPIRLDGRWHVALISHDGVGWRESTRTLLAIYDEEGGKPIPKAGFQIDLVNAGLAEAEVGPAEPASGPP
jgi:hypothetical protein